MTADEWMALNGFDPSVQVARYDGIRLIEPIALGWIVRHVWDAAYSAGWSEALDYGWCD